MSDSSLDDVIMYPEGCKTVGPGISTEKLTTRLKVIATTFQNMADQTRDTKRQLAPLCIHLCDEFFLNHAVKDVRLLIANILGDILRIYAPDPPYNSRALRSVLEFLIQELDGLQNPSDRVFTRSFYLLENLNHSKCLNLLLPEHDDLTLKLFTTVFKLVNETQAERIKNFLVDLLTPLWDPKNDDLLNVIMSNIIEPGKTRRPERYELASALIRRSSDSIASTLQGFLIRSLVDSSGPSVSTQQPVLVKRVVDLIGELHAICPTLLQLVWPHFDLKVRNELAAERLKSVHVLGSIFSREYSKLAFEHRGLWLEFIGRFKDFSSEVRLSCVSYAAEIFRYHESLRNDLLEAMKDRSLDRDESVRLVVVKTMIGIGIMDLGFITEDVQDFLGCRTKDKKPKVRKAAIKGLGEIYKKTTGDLLLDRIPAHLGPTIKWIQNSIFHAYHLPEVQDKMNVEYIFLKQMVLFNTSAPGRVLKLVYLYLGLDEVGTRAFALLQQNQMKIRTKVKAMLDFIEQRNWRSTENEALNNQLLIHVRNVCNSLPEPTRAQIQIVQFGKSLKTDKALVGLLKTILDPESDSAVLTQANNDILNKLDQTNVPFYTTVKNLLQRCALFLIDKDAAGELVRILYKLAEVDEDLMTMLNIESGIDGLNKGLVLLRLLCAVYPEHFSSEVANLIRLLGKIPRDSRHELISSITLLVHRTGKKIDPPIMGFVLPQCKLLILEGTGKEAKAAIRCIAMNCGNNAEYFAELLPGLISNLEYGNKQFLSSLMSLGHIARKNPTNCQPELRRIMKKIVKTLLIKPQRSPEDQAKNEQDWCPFEDLPEITQAMIVGMKAVVRWIIGMQSDVEFPKKVNNVLTGFVHDPQDMKPNVPFNEAEKSWLRVSAANIFLLLCRFKVVGDTYTPVQLATMSRMFADPVPEVRQLFGAKLFKGLAKGPAFSWYPVEFLAMYSLAGYETDRKHLKRVKAQITDAFTLRLNTIQDLKLRGDEKSISYIPLFMPEHIIIYALPFLSVTNPRFTDRTSVDQLNGVKNCLWTVIEPLMKLPDFTYSFYAQLIQGIKDTEQVLRPNDHEANMRMYAVCDLATGLLLQKVKNTDPDPNAKTIIPRDYFQCIEENYRSYLPPNYEDFKPSPRRALAPARVPKPKRPLPNIDQEDEDLEVTKRIGAESDVSFQMTPRRSPAKRSRVRELALEPVTEEEEVQEISLDDSGSEVSQASSGGIATNETNEVNNNVNVKAKASGLRKPMMKKTRVTPAKASGSGLHGKLVKKTPVTPKASGLRAKSMKKTTVTPATASGRRAKSMKKATVTPAKASGLRGKPIKKTPVTPAKPSAVRERALKKTPVTPAKAKSTRKPKK